MAIKTNTSCSTLTKFHLPNGYIPSNEWVTKEWAGLAEFNGNNIWTDGTNIYYSVQNNVDQYRWNGNAWEAMTWSGLTSFYGYSVWTDGTNIYSSSGYILNGTNWEPLVMDNTPSSYFSAKNIWTDGTNIYYSRGSTQLVLNGTTWETMTWGGNCDSYLYGEYVWTDGNKIYCSRTGVTIALNGTTWESVTWSGDNPYPSGNQIWTDGTNIYYSSTTKQYRLNGDTWEVFTWNGDFTQISGSHVWTDGTNIYYSATANQYVLKGEIIEPEPEASPISPYLRKSGAWQKQDTYKRVGGQWVKQTQAGYETVESVWQPIFEKVEEPTGEPIAYLYNGVQLPDINKVWTDKETYPYAYMELVISSTQTGTVLVLTSNPMFVGTDSNGNFSSMLTASTKVFSYSTLVEDGASWDIMNNYTNDEEDPFSNLDNDIISALWANYDVMNRDDGSVYLAASDPVPVYE